jgi:hypothetical protein
MAKQVVVHRAYKNPFEHKECTLTISKGSNSKRINYSRWGMQQIGHNYLNLILNTDIEFTCNFANKYFHSSNHGIQCVQRMGGENFP